MRNKKPVEVVIDTGAIISLAVIRKLDLLTQLFDKVTIPNAVWEELIDCNIFEDFSPINSFFKSKVRNVESFNSFSLIMGYGESECVLLYQELGADFLVIDDRKARLIAEESDVNCIGTLGILIKAKEKGLFKSLKPIFETLLKKKRYYTKRVLNTILIKSGEDTLKE